MKVVKDESIKIGGIPVETEIALNKKQEAELAELKAELKRRRKVRLKLFAVALLFSTTLFLLKCNIWFALIPLYLHVLLLFYSYAVVHYNNRKKSKYWAKYVAKYGGKLGAKPDEIHPSIQAQHRIMLRLGKKIPID